LYGINKLGKQIPTPFRFDDVNLALLDGEAVGSKLYAFDLLQFNERDLRALPYIERYIELCAFIDGHCDENVELVPLFQSEQGKRRLFKKVKEEGGEGLVFKLLEAPYTAGRPNSGGPQLKMKFWAHTQARVRMITEGKRSVTLECRESGTGYWFGVGTVTIPPNHPIPKPYDFVEVRYLYYYEGGSLFQPIYEGLRTDCVPEDCDISKLKLFVPEE